jgi:predicted SnoaL-like aldol condensation-catalyzing enzyme
MSLRPRVKCFAPAVAALVAAMWCPGTPAATYSSQEQSNMKVVTDFYAALDRGDASGDLQQRIRSIAEQYLRPDYIQHREGAREFGAGREGFIHMFEQMPSMPRPPSAAGAPPAPKVLALMADGDLVVRVSSREAPGPGGKEPSTLYIYNVFRVQDGKLAEHWDGSSGGMMGPNQMPPKTGAPSPGAAPIQPPPK